MDVHIISVKVGFVSLGNEMVTKQMSERSDRHSFLYFSLSHLVPRSGIRLSCYLLYHAFPVKISRNTWTVLTAEFFLKKS